MAECKEDFYDSFARAMAPIRLELAAGKGNLPTSVSFLQGFGVREPQELAGPGRWADATPERSMAVPIGVRTTKSFSSIFMKRKAVPTVW